MNETHHNAFLFSMIVIDLKFNLLLMSRLDFLSFVKPLVPCRSLSPLTN